MSKRIVCTNIRFNLEKEVDRAAWEHLQQRDKWQYRSYSKAVIAAVNDYFERQGRLDSDPYLETREKEDAFLLRVLETIRAGLNQSAPANAADTLLRLLQGNCADDQGMTVVKQQVVSMESSLETLNQQEKKYTAELDAALAQYAALQQQAADLDAMELDTARHAIRPDKKREAAQQLHAVYGKRFNSPTLAQSQKDIAALLGEAAEPTSIRQQLQKIPENINNRHSKKHQDQER